ncbi:DNA gyrase C-terminal beta-propeller domain-containing protein [Haloferax sp. YSMS24]|uniref:DNA gyrase C-terminal beta-propeller domain-containing protein n=1 Tax=Haloferax sp. YSMS24 TaxID=3388425 RepID=UPI00398D0372
MATADGNITASTDIEGGRFRSVHAIEMGVWKAYSEAQSPVTNVLVQAGDDGYTPCGCCLQAILDYSTEASIRILDQSGEEVDELSLNQPSILEVIGEAKKAGGRQATDAGTDDSDEDESLSIPEKPPFSDIEPDENSEIEYVRLNNPIYHIKYQSHNQTFCGTDLSNRKTVSSTEKPILLDPCKPCHGETNIETVEEQRIRLRAQLSEMVDAVKATEADPEIFDENEVAEVLEQLPVEAPIGGTDAIALRDRLSQTVVDIHAQPENPLTFSRSEMGALLAALDGEGTISNDPYLFVHTSAGRVARIPLSNLSLQRRAGKGELALSLSDNEMPTTTLAITPREQLYVFTSSGQVYKVDAHRIPEVHRGGNPTPLSDVVNLKEDETLQAAFTSRGLENHGYVILATKDGYIKRTGTDQFENILSSGIIAINLEGGDALRDACLLDGDFDLLMSTKDGRAISFNATDVRPMGREARGVKGIKLDNNDEVVGTNVVDARSELKVLTVTAGGYGKRTAVGKYRNQSRNGRGLIDIDTGDRNGPVVAVEMASEDSELVAISKDGRTIHSNVDEVSVQGRNTMGVEIMELNDDDLLAGMTVFET